MRKMLEDLYNGRIIPYEQKHVQSEKYHEAVKRMERTELSLCSRFRSSLSKVGFQLPYFSISSSSFNTIHHGNFDSDTIDFLSKLLIDILVGWR